MWASLGCSASLLHLIVRSLLALCQPACGHTHGDVVPWLEAQALWWPQASDDSFLGLFLHL